MAELSAEDVPATIASLRKSSVVAAAGCGKTELIVRATEAGQGRRLILTHTHAGVDALRRRLKLRKVAAQFYAVDTIASWALRFASAFPATSGLSPETPRTTADWTAVYEAATRLVTSRAVTRVLQASYAGVFVDEYQDCGSPQHGLICALADTLPTVLFGDPLQAIFDFKGQKPVDWDLDVFPGFGKFGVLRTPHRWRRHGQTEFADWLSASRTVLEGDQPLDFTARPTNVTWETLPDDAAQRQQTILTACRRMMGRGGDVVVIADPVNLGGRANLAKSLAKQGFSNIEPVECPTADQLLRKLDAARGARRLVVTLDLIKACISGAHATAFAQAVESRKGGGRKGATQFGSLIDLGVTVEASGSDDQVLALINGFAARPDTFVFRREMLSAIRAALAMRIRGECSDLAEALWRVQNRTRHAGRRIAHRSVGSTLLVKGLEFANAVVIHSDGMSRKDWYVALTRATHNLTVLSPSIRFSPPA